MNISPAVYESLPPQARVVATLEAEVRGDATEVKRLVQSCPRKHYTLTDPAFSGTMEALADLTFAVEAELCGQALHFVMAKAHAPECRAAFLCNMLSVRAAWHEVLAARGIDPDLIARVFPDARHRVVQSLLAGTDKALASDLQEQRDYEAATGKPCPFDPSLFAPDPAEIAAWREAYEGVFEATIWH